MSIRSFSWYAREVEKEKELSRFAPAFALLPARPPTFLHLTTDEQHPLHHQHRNNDIIMALTEPSTPLTNGAHSESKSIDLAVDLPHSPGLKVNLRLTVLANSILLFLTSSSADSSQGAAAMGSFVYGLPDVSSDVVIESSS